MSGPRVIVCGGRDYYDRTRIWEELDELAPAEVAQGGATGADILARDWCAARGVRCFTYQASWEREGRSAGPRRNQRMLDDFRPSMVLAFPGGVGTADMVVRAHRGRVPVRTVEL